MRREQQAKSQERRAQQQIEEQLDDQTTGSYTRPNRKDCKEREFYLPVDDSDTVRISVRLWHYPGQGLADFHLGIETFAWGTWTRVIEIDCCHGHVHLHHVIDGTKQKASKSYMALEDASDVQTGYRTASAKANQAAIRIRDDGGQDERAKDG